MYTTLNKILAHKPCGLEPGCGNGLDKLLTHLGKTACDDEPLPFATILESNGLDDAIWAMRSATEYDRQWRLYAVACARDVQHLTTDQRSIAALDVAERFANGMATAAELKAARAAAGAAWAAAMAEEGAAAGAAWAAWSAAMKEAGEAARAAGAEEGAAVRTKQTARLLELFTNS